MTDSIVTLDLHGMNRFQAKTAVDACLRRSGAGVYQIRLIHGHHSGTSLKEMIVSEYGRHPKIRRMTFPHPGETVLVLRELI